MDLSVRISLLPSLDPSQVQQVVASEDFFTLVFMLQAWYRSFGTRCARTRPSSLSSWRAVHGSGPGYTLSQVCVCVCVSVCECMYVCVFVYVSYYQHLRVNAKLTF